MIMKKIQILFLIFLLGSCNTLKHSYTSTKMDSWENNQLPTDANLKHSFYLVGELGSSEVSKNPLVPILKKQIEQENEHSTIVFLGSHLYPKGLSKKGKKTRPEEEQQLLNTFNIVENFPGNYFFISGEHDWEYRGDKGLKAIKRMEDFAEDNLTAKDFFLPEDGCGDPVKVKVEKDFVILFLNTQWWLEDWKNEKKINKGCDIKSRTEFTDKVKELIQRNKNKQLMVVMHHPPHSNGVHGVNIPAKYHLFPLTEIKPKAFVPLPIFGSMAAMHRKVVGTKQDATNAMYQRLQDEIFSGIVDVRDIIFVGAHDKSLQYFNLDQQHYVVSGSAGGDGFARKGGRADFASAKQGFSKILFYDNREVWMEFYGMEKGQLKLIFRKQLKQGKSNLDDVMQSTEIETEWKDSITLSAGEIYGAKKVKKFIFGNTYRDVWTLPVTVPVINLENEHGGLTPIRKGGGQQSNSMRLEDSLGNQYVLRSIMKSATKTTPEFARNSWVENLLQDGLSASHPYGAFVIPKLSKAANIYYTEPKLVYVPKQTTLGIYNENFGNELYLYEDRLSGNRSTKANFGYTKEIIGINDLLPKLDKNKVKNVIDQEWTLRSRLFDLFVHDWDRHDDQWRWATFEEGEKTIYRPIPRDRDQVFFRFNGVMYTVAAGLFLKNFRTFKHDLKKPHRQSLNARIFDRVFLNQMTLEDFQREARFLQENLTDEVIETSIKDWPDDIYKLNGDVVVEKLKSRRGHLEEMATTLYRFLSKKVNVLGTEKRDKFVVERLPDGKTKVTVSSISKKGKDKGTYFTRVFDKKDTKEIRLYGFSGKDVFEIDGKVKKGIKIRIIAGSNKDQLTDNSKVRGLRKFTKVYDEKDGIEYNKSGEIQNMTSNAYEVNDYERDENYYSNMLPIISFGSNIDDGFFFGGGFSATVPGFRGKPYKASHSLSGTYAPSTNAFSVNYSLDRLNTFHRMGGDFIFNADLQQPRYVSFYGIGNNTPFDENIDDEFNFVRLIDYNISTGIKKNWLNGRYILKFGPMFRSTEVDVVPGRISEAPQAGLTAEDKERKNMLGGFVDIDVNSIQTEGIRPVEGIGLQFKSKYLNQIKGNSNFATFNMEMRYFITFFKKLPTTIGTRVGAGINVGNVPFYLSNNLGGVDYLRGYRRDRFTGKYMFYQNIDVRIKLFYWQNKVLPFEFGLLGGFDYGRVWQPNESSSEKMHLGYSAGIWLTPFKMMAVNFNYNISKETKMFSFGMGFFF